jgi:hypothetical protein
MGEVTPDAHRHRSGNEGGETRIRADELRDYIDGLERTGQGPKRRSGPAAGRVRYDSPRG